MERNGAAPCFYTALDLVILPQGETVQLIDPMANHLFNLGERAGFPKDKQFEPIRSGA